MADGRQILEIVMGGSSAAQGGGIEGSSSPNKSENALSTMAKKLGLSSENEKDTAEGTKGMAKKFDGFIKNQLGISFNLANILKQSQIFTSFVGTIFQLMGALVDVILAPFLPILIPVITKVASWIPAIGNASQWVADKLVEAFAWAGKKWEEFSAWWSEVNGFLTPVRNVVNSIWDEVTEWASDISLSNIAITITRIWEIAGDRIKGFLDDIWTNFKGWADDVKKSVDDVPGTVWTKLGRGLLWLVKGVARLLDNMVKGILGALPLGAIWKLLYSFGKTVFKFFGGIGLMLAKLFLRAGKWIITEGVGWLMGKITGLLGKVLNPIWDLAKAVGSKIPFVGKAFKNLDNLPLMGKALKRVPVIGTVAQLGFGALETYQATKKYGWQAGLAFGGKNLAAAGAGFGDLVMPGAGTVAAAGIDIGGTIALTKYYDGKLAEKEAQKQTNLTVNLQTTEGYDIQSKHFAGLSSNAEVNDNMEFDLAAHKG